MLELDYDQLIQVYKHKVKGDTYVSRCELQKGNKGSKKNERKLSIGVLF